MPTATITTSLSDIISGRVVEPGDADWGSARQTFNPAVDQRPAAIAYPADERDVIAAVGYARERGLRIAPQSTGHNAGPLRPLHDTILLNVRELDGVSIDAAGRRVRVGAGATWQDVTPALSAHGLGALHGSSPDVGIAGYSLAGGMGWLARKHGLQANSVTAIEIVTADGHLVRTDAGHEPELFWALRGGGGNFGVVTAIEFAVYPVAALYAGAMFFAFERAPDVLHAWTKQLPEFPDELTSWASMLHLPDTPDVPAQVRGRSVTAVFAAFLGGEEEGRRLLRPLRELGPEIDTFATVAPAVLGNLAMDPRKPAAYASAHELLGALPPTAIDDLLAAAGPGTGSALAKVQLRHLGGALARTSTASGARATLPGTVSLFSLGIVSDPAARTAVESSLERVRYALRTHHAGEYPGFVEQPADASRFFDRDTWRRLQDVKALYDPADLFEGNHHIPLANTVDDGHDRGRAVAGSPGSGSGSHRGDSGSVVIRNLEAFRVTPVVTLFQGRQDGIETSVYDTSFEPGDGPRLHRHPYPEVFLVDEGRALFHVDGDRYEVTAGHLVVVAAETPHRYENPGPAPLRVISVHPNGVTIQTNL